MEETSRLATLAEGFCLALVGAALGLIQVLIGGTRPIFALPAYALLGLAAVASVASWRNTRPSPDLLCFCATALFFGWIIGRAFASPVAYLARLDLFPVLAGLGVYFLIATVSVSARQRMLLLAFLLVLALGHVVVGGLQFRDGSNFMPISFLQRYDYGRRASGFYVCPNHLAGLLEVLIVAGLSLVCWSRWPTWAKLLMGYLVVMASAGLLMTGSRGGYLSVLAGLITFGLLSLFLLRKTGKQFFRRLLVAGAALLALAAVTVTLTLRSSDLLRERAGNTFDVANMRVDLWQAALRQWQLEPVAGTGSGTFLFYGREFRTERVDRDPIHVHNDYLQLLAEYGLIGAATFLLFFAAHLRRGLKNFRRLGPGRLATSPNLLSNAMAINIGALSALATYTVHSALDFNLHIPANILLLAAIFGMIANDGVFRQKERPARASRVWPARLVLPTLGVLLLFISSRYLPSEYYAEKARTSVRDHRFVLASYYARRGLELEKTNPELYYSLGLALGSLGEQARPSAAAASFFTAAAAAFGEARALAPRDVFYALELAFTLGNLGRREEADQVFQQALALDPNSASLRRYYASFVQEHSLEKPPSIPLEEGRNPNL